jgi:hypothetical protein
MCGSKRMEFKPVTVQLRNGIRVGPMEVEVCPKCGEQYYDYYAMQMIGEARRRTRPRKKSE